MDTCQLVAGSAAVVRDLGGGVLSAELPAAAVKPGTLTALERVLDGCGGRQRRYLGFLVGVAEAARQR